MLTYSAWLAWRHLTARKLQSAVAVVSVALAVALTLAVVTLADGVRRGMVRAADPFGVLVVGPKGSAQQLVLNTLLLQGEPLGTLPGQVYAELLADPGTRLAVPLGMGDNVGGAPIIGTDLSFFELRSDSQAPPAFHLSQGRLFEPPLDDHAATEAETAGHAGDGDVYDAVLGSRAASQLGLGLGDRFQGAHGVTVTPLEGDRHPTMYEVVGILQPSQTPYDAAVFTPIQAVWAAHGAGQAPSALAVEAVDAASAGRVTAVLVLPVSYADTYRLWQTYYTRTDAQAALPGQQLGSLFDLMNTGARVLNSVGGLVLVVAALTVFLALYGAALAREQALAVMRALGSSPGHLFQLVLFESLLITTSGALLGRLLGYAAALLAARQINANLFIPVPVQYQLELELPLWLGTLGLAALAGAMPAVMAYRVNVAEKLFPA